MKNVRVQNGRKRPKSLALAGTYEKFSAECLQIPPVLVRIAGKAVGFATRGSCSGHRAFIQYVAMVLNGAY